MSPRFECDEYLVTDVGDEHRSAIAAGHHRGDACPDAGVGDSRQADEYARQIFAITIVEDVAV